MLVSLYLTLFHHFPKIQLIKRDRKWSESFYSDLNSFEKLKNGEFNFVKY